MTKNEALRHYLESLSTKERIAKSRDIREQLGVSVFVLSNWTCNRTEIPPLYFDKIIEIVGVDLKSYINK